MAVISPPILKLLSDLDIDLMDIDNDMDYLRALMEAANALTISNPSDKRIPILQKEVKRVRDNRKAKSQITKKTISTSKLLNRKSKGDVGAKGMESNTGKLARILRDTRGKVLSNEKKIDLLGKPKESEENGNNADLLVIKEKVISIAALLGDQYKLKEDQAKDARKLRERKGRKLSENLLEGGKKVWEGVKKTGEKILAPFQSVWKNILGFIGKIIVGRVLFKILEWAGDPKNQDKIKSIGKFFNDFWPVMLAGYLLFGNSLTSMVTGMLIQMGKWLAPMLLAIGKLMLNPWVLAAMGTGAAIYAIGKTIGKDKEGENIAEATNESTEAIVDEGNMDEGEAGVLSQSVTTENVDRMTQGDTNLRSNNNMLQTGMDDPLSGGRLGLNKGGTVPGSGNKDTVPAMLTPGEFVMSKGAVQKYGANTMESMNAAAGGTNKPTLLRGYNEGGKATPMSTEDLVAAAGPSLQMFMEQNNAAIDSDPDAIYGEHMRMELDRDGKMINFGKTIANMSEWAFNSGVEQLQNNESIDPDVKEALLKKMAWVRRETLENPNFKADMAFDINKDIPGTAANRLYLRAQNSPQNIAIKAGIDPAEVARLWNRRGMSGGGLVQGFQGGGGVELIGPAEGFGKGKAGIKKFSGSQLKGLLDSQKGIGATPVKKTPIISPPIKKIPTITPPVKKNIIVDYNEQGGSMKSSNNKLPQQTNKEVPSFSAIAMRSPDKINVLGISV